MKVSIIEVQSALTILWGEVQTSEGAEAYELLCKYIDQQRQKAIEEGTLIVENPAIKN